MSKNCTKLQDQEGNYNSSVPSTSQTIVLEGCGMLTSSLWRNCREKKLKTKKPVMDKNFQMFPGAHSLRKLTLQILVIGRMRGEKPCTCVNSAEGIRGGEPWSIGDRNPLEGGRRDV